MFIVVDGLADDVRVRCVACGLLDHVHRNPSKVARDHRPRTRRVEIDRPEDLLRRNDLLAVVGDHRLDGVVITITPTWVKILDFETTIPKAVEDLIKEKTAAG